jgi:hypothetical protein
MVEILRHDLASEVGSLGCELGMRYWPGYAKWELKEQEEILTILDGQESGLTLTESHYMVPPKILIRSVQFSTIPD